MESPDKPLKPWQALLAAVFLLPLGLWIGWRGLACFDDAGQWWRGRVRDSFVETPARVENVWASRVKRKNSTVAIEILIEARYRVDGVEHRIVDVEEKVVGGAVYGSDFEKMEARAKEIRRTRATVGVFYDPAHPGYAVLKKESLPGFFRSVFMGFFGCVIELMALALAAMGVVPILLGLRAVASRFLPGRTSKPVLRPRTEPTPAAPRPQPEPERPRDPAPLTGDSKKDYYSGALTDHALGSWEGFWCEIFLMPDRSIVVAHDNSTHHYFRTWSVDDVIAGRSDILFDDNQQEAREAFERRIRQPHG